MRSRRITTRVGVAAGLVGLVAVAVTVAAGQSGTSAGHTTTSPSTAAYRGPVASASGGSATVLVYPSVVDVHLDRARAAMGRAETAADNGKTGPVAAQMTTALAHVRQAWAATRYVIRTTPPPPPADDRAGAGGGAPAGPSFASPPDTSVAVFTLQHDFNATAAGLLGADPGLNATLTGAMRTAARVRVRAVKYIHRVAPPAPPGDRAGASGGAVAPTFDAVMPGVLPLLNDEIQALRGTIALNKSLPAAAAGDVRAVVRKDRVTKRKINRFWPPIVGDD